MSNTIALNGMNPNAASLLAIDAQAMLTVDASDPPAEPLGPADPSFTTMSPETLLSFCQMQLGGLDSEINDQMNTQHTALRQREAVESAENVLESFGSAGPTNIDDMTRCITAVDSAIAQLPAGDPIAQQLATFRDKMTTTYNYQPPGAPSGADQTELANDEAVQPPDGSGGLGAAAQAAAYARAQADITRLTDGTFTKPADGQWQGTTDALDSLSKDIASGAEVQLLKLQDLVSQRQQAVQLVTGMMTKADQTLEDQAKAVGQ